MHFIHVAVSTSVEKQTQELLKKKPTTYAAEEQLEINSLSSPEQIGWKVQN